MDGGEKRGKEARMGEMEGEDEEGELGEGERVDRRGRAART